MKRLFAPLLLSATLAVPGAAPAAEWPQQPIRLVVNFATGGAADRLARIISPHLQEALGQPVVVENRGGAGGNIGGDHVAKSPPDGYTFLMSSGGMVSTNPHLYSNMSFDPARDLVPVASAARVQFFLVVRADSDIRDFAAFTDDLKRNPGARSYGSPGNGSAPHLAAEMMIGQTGAQAVHVPYRGAAPALTDLLGGQIDFLFDPGISLPHVESGRLRMLAVASSERSPQVPGVPTLHELGLAGFDADSLFGIYAPAGTPQPIVERMNTEVNRVLALPAVQRAIVDMGNVPTMMTPAEFGARGTQDHDRLGAVIRERGIRVE